MNLSIETIKKLNNSNEETVVIQCNSKEEWDHLISIFAASLFTSWDDTQKNGIEYKNPCFNPFKKQYCSEKYYSVVGYIVIQYKDFIACENQLIYEIY